jgi:lipoprotein NlpD
LNACALMNNNWDSQAYIVRPKETLYSIAWRYSLDYRELARWNNISSPYIIQPGQKIWLSEARGRRSTAANSPASSETTVLTRTQNNNVPLKPKRTEELRTTVAKQKTEAPPSAWQWPTAGRVIKQFQGSKSASQGITIEGKLQQSILATASGKVVYSGNGLIGYGNLLIVKHNDTYLSAYAHNQTLLVSEGENVNSGQKIAEMGRVNGGQAQLHFEIRKDGEPVDPLRYLPTR